MPSLGLEVPRDQWSWLEGPGLSLGPGLEGWGFGLGPKFLASLQITSSIPNILWICTINLIFLTRNKTLWYTRSKTKEHIALSEIHLKTMGRHLWMGSQCYLPPDRHNQTGWYLIYRPCKDERLSWPSWLVLYRDGLPSHRWSHIPVLTTTVNWHLLSVWNEKIILLRCRSWTHLLICIIQSAFSMAVAA